VREPWEPRGPPAVTWVLGVPPLSQIGCSPPSLTALDSASTITSRYRRGVYCNRKHGSQLSKTGGCHNLLGCIAAYTFGCRRGVYRNRKHGSQLSKTGGVEQYELGTV
jgi:hypothetical protein